MLAEINVAATAFVAEVYKPTSEEPPGAEGFKKIANWIFWGSSLVFVVCLIFAGVMMAVNHQRGVSNEGAAKVGWTLGGILIASFASSIVSVLLV